MPFATGFAVGFGLSKPCFLFFVFPVNSNLCELDRSLRGLTLSMCPYQADIKCQGVSQKHCGGEGGRFGE